MDDTLLLVVDVQNGFVSEKTAFVVPRILEILNQKRFQQVAFTQFLNEEESVYERYLRWERLRSDEERAIHGDLLWAAETVFRKTYYSAVTPEFHSYVEARGIKTVHIAGIDTDCCVLTSAIDIMGLGIRPLVLASCCASNGGQESHDAALRVMTRTIGRDQIVWD